MLAPIIIHNSIIFLSCFLKLGSQNLCILRIVLFRRNQNMSIRVYPKHPFTPVLLLFLQADVRKFFRILITPDIWFNELLHFRCTELVLLSSPPGEYLQKRSSPYSLPDNWILGPDSFRKPSQADR